MQEVPVVVTIAMDSKLVASGYFILENAGISFLKQCFLKNFCYKPIIYKSVWPNMVFGFVEILNNLVMLYL